MSLSRKMFTKEFKEAAVWRLKMGALLAEVAGAREVNLNVLHRWRRELPVGLCRAALSNASHRPLQIQAERHRGGPYER